MGDAKVIPFDDDRDRTPGASGPSDSGPFDSGRSGPGREGSGRPRSGRSASSRAGRSRTSQQSGDVSPLAPVPEQQRPRGGDSDSDHNPVDASESGAHGTPTGAADDGHGGGRRIDNGVWERRAAHGLEFLRRRLTGDYEVDEFGYDEDLTEQVLMSLLRPVYERYFRVEVQGVENIPDAGGALVVANHSGTLPLDGLMLQVAVHDHHPAGRSLRLLAADLVFMMPVINQLARKAGHTLACAQDAQRLLSDGQVVGVMPEGFKGVGKPFTERYKLQRFGRGGFVSTALRAGVPIVPCSIVGAEEIYPMVGNLKSLARLLNLPYFPVTPTFPWLGPLGAVPLPSKWTIRFDEPIRTEDYAEEAADDPTLMFNLTDQVRETIQHTLYKLLVGRRSVFF